MIYVFTSGTWRSLVFVRSAIILSYDVASGSEITPFIVYKEMKYGKISIKYNVYLKNLYFTAVKIYKLYFTGGICPLLFEPTPES